MEKFPLSILFVFTVEWANLSRGLLKKKFKICRNHYFSFSLCGSDFFLFLVQGAGEARLLLSSEDFTSNQTVAIEIVMNPESILIRSQPSMMEYNSTNVSVCVCVFCVDILINIHSLMPEVQRLQAYKLV